MNILKKTISVFLMILLIAGVFTSCGSSDKKQSDKSLQIVTTVFPAYDWTKEILGDRAEDAELTMLLDDGVDVHSYQPTAEDLEKIASCDLFIYVGGESDEWVEDALKSKTNKMIRAKKILFRLLVMIQTTPQNPVLPIHFHLRNFHSNLLRKLQ